MQLKDLASLQEARLDYGEVQDMIEPASRVKRKQYSEPTKFYNSLCKHSYNGIHSVFMFYLTFHHYKVHK